MYRKLFCKKIIADNVAEVFPGCLTVWRFFFWKKITKKKTQALVKSTVLAVELFANWKLHLKISKKIKVFSVYALESKNAV